MGQPLNALNYLLALLFPSLEHRYYDQLVSRINKCLKSCVVQITDSNLGST